MEEAWEAAGAIEADDDRNLCEELGDLYLLVTMISWMRQQDGGFGPARDALEKIVRTVRESENERRAQTVTSVESWIANRARIERTYGAFSRTFSLPTTVDTSKVSADYKNGVLTITLPVREEAKPKQIQVHVQG